ncbi:hypothetical protein D3C87_298580 [compost metagenome]
MAKWIRITLSVVVGMVLPVISKAQGGIADEMHGMQGVLEHLYDEMMPMCRGLIGVGQGIAGFAALWYISSRVWRHLANAEPIDFYPLFRPFVLGMCIMMFPMVLNLINGVMKPTVVGTAKMMEGSNQAIKTLLKQKEEAIKKTDAWLMYVGDDNMGDFGKWYKYTHEDQSIISNMMDPTGIVGDGVSFMMSKMAYQFRNSVKAWMSEVLRILYEAAALCIDTLRTFQMVVLAILGPLVFGIAVFDGLQHTLSAWLARYLNVFLWLPVANIFGAIISKVQVQMIKLDLSQIGATGDTFFSSNDVAYIVFMIIGIAGYFMVPSISSYIINAGGGGALGQKVTSMMSSAASAPGAAVTSAIDTKKSYDDGKKYDAGTGVSGALGRMAGGGNSNGSSNGDYQHSKLSGRG